MRFELPGGMAQLPRHQQRLLAACEVGRSEADVLGMALAGSFADGEPDGYSDLDIRMVLADGSLPRVFPRREEIARACGPLVAAFTGEHVGEPQLLVTLYEDLVHVDYLFMEVSDAAARNQGRPALILWQRNTKVQRALSTPFSPDPVEDLTYMEARIWTWTWYILSKILRGELWEAASGLGLVRDWVLFRLLALAHERRYRGARFAEELIGEHAGTIERTQASVDRESLLGALRATVHLYIRLADPLLVQHGVEPQQAARRAVMPALDAGLSWRPPAAR